MQKAHGIITTSVMLFQPLIHLFRSRCLNVNWLKT